MSKAKTVEAIGFTYTYTSFAMAMNLYFNKGRNRSRASGLLMGFSGLGPVLMPQFISFSITMYGVTATAFLLAAINAHGFVAASLLRPVKWYMKKVKLPETGNDITIVVGNAEENLINREISKDGGLKDESIIDEEDEETDGEKSVVQIDAESVLGMEPMTGLDLVRRRSSVSRTFNLTGGKFQMVPGAEPRRYRSVSESEDADFRHEKVRRLSSIERSNLENVREHEEPGENDFLQSRDELDNAMMSTLDLVNVNYFPIAKTESLGSIGGYSFGLPSKLPSSAHLSVQNINEKTATSCWGNTWKKVQNQFDLDLLRDPKFMMISLGLSIAVIGELLFSLLTPFILAEVGMDLQETASFMSTVAICDIFARFVAPYIAEFLKRDSKMMYSWSLFFLLVSRASLLVVSGKIYLIIVALVIGLAKGVRSVFWIQVLPDNVPREKLGSAMSFQGLTNGILIFIAGPLAGLIVEINNSYLNIIYVSNILTMCTIVLWGGEWLYYRCKARKSKRAERS